MKNLDKAVKLDKAQIVNTRQVPKALVLKANEDLKPGQKLFKINLQTGQISEVEPVESTIVPKYSEPNKKGKRRVYTTTKHSKVIIEQYCVYVPAINKANALKQLEKRHAKAYAFYQKTFINK